MKAIFNGKIIEEGNFHLSHTNRAFAYGDGIFETMLANNGRVKLLDLHMERIMEGIDLLKMTIDQPWNVAHIANLIAALLQENNITAFGKVKIYVWRATGGSYEPTLNTANYLITADQVDKKAPQLLKSVGIATQVFNQAQAFSNLKTMNALPYVIAGLEKKERGLDEIIICDNEGHISECLISNIFCVKGNDVITPALSTGCINGVARRYLMKAFAAYGTTVKEVAQYKSMLLNADHIFTANAMGINHLVTFENRNFLPFPAIEMIYQPYSA